MQRGNNTIAGGNVPTGASELLFVISHVLKQKRAQMGRGNLSRSTVREVFQSQTINVAKLHYILTENIWSKDSVPAKEAMLNTADILCATDMFKLVSSDAKLCLTAYADFMNDASWESKSHAFKAQLAIKLPPPKAFDGDYDGALAIAKDALASLVACGTNAFIPSTAASEDGAGGTAFNIKHVLLLATLLLVDGRLGDTLHSWMISSTRFSV